MRTFALTLSMCFLFLAPSTGCESGSEEVGEVTSKSELEQYLEDNPEVANAEMAELDG
jgi:hypothetical protein